MTRRTMLLGTTMLPVIAGLSAACAGAPAVTSNAGPTAVKGPVTIEVLTRAGVALPTGHSQFYARITPQLFTPQSNVTVTFVEGDPDVTQKLIVLAASNSLPDVSWYGVIGDGAGGPQAATQGVFKPLDDWAKKDSTFDTKPYFKALLEAFSVNGKQYAFPVHGHYGSNIVYFNAALTKAAGLSIPTDGAWTVDQLVTAAQKLVRSDQGIWGFFPSGATDANEYIPFYARLFGGELLDPAGKKCLLDSAEARAGLEWVYNCQSKFQVIDDLFRNGGAGALFNPGQLGLYSSNAAGVATLKKPGQEVIKFELGVALFPKGPAGKLASQVSGSGMGMVGTTKQAAAWEWIKFITSKEVGVLGMISGGAGNLGGRDDVWTDPRVLAWDPIFGITQKQYPTGPDTMRRPANHRRPELNTVIVEEIKPYFQGQVGLNDATTRLVQRANALLAQA